MKKLIIILISISYTVSYAQDARLGLYFGYGTYMMNDLKDLQTELLNETIYAKKTEEFPGFFNYALTLEYCLNKHLLGFNVGYYTTGGQNSVSDYSGKYSLDMPVNGIRVGVQYGYLFPSSEKLSVTPRLSAGYMMTSLRITESLIIYNVDTHSDTYDFKSSGFFLEPSVGLYHTLWKDIGLQYSVGYQVNTDNKFHLKGNKKAYLNNSSGDPVKPGWSGIRLQIGIIIMI